jgi:rSAM/selenodomain-associated transferase 2
VVIPCLNEAARLPLLLADLQRWPGPLEVMVVDGGSSDDSKAVAQLAGAHWLQAPDRGRGQQLAFGAARATGPWLLFLHADSRLTVEWPAAVEAAMQSTEPKRAAWYFDLTVRPSRLDLKLMEAAVAARSRWQQSPYGDQGLLLHASLYRHSGGYAPLPLMEDLELVERLGHLVKLKPLGLALISDGRRWAGTNALRQALRNAHLRRAWRQGTPATELCRAYYRRSR